MARSRGTLPFGTLPFGTLPWHAPVASFRGTLPARAQAPRVAKPQILMENTFTNGLQLKP